MCIYYVQKKFNADQCINITCYKGRIKLGNIYEKAESFSDYKIGYIDRTNDE